MNVGIIGLGVMGGAFAFHLLKNNVNVYGLEPNKNNAKAFQNIKGKILPGINELFEKCDYIITSLPSVKSYKDILNEILKETRFSVKKTIIDMNTISIIDKVYFKKHVKPLNIDLIDCPVSGTGAQAKNADISVFASGKKSIIDKSMDILRSFSKEVIYVGKFGNGMKLKVLANLLVTIHNTAAAEALHLGELAGLSKKLIYETLINSAATSTMLEKRMPLMMKKKYNPPTASFNIFMKDIDIIRKFIMDKKTSLPTFEASSLIYDLASSKLSNKIDTAAVYEIIKQRGRKNGKK